LAPPYYNINKKRREYKKETGRKVLFYDNRKKFYEILKGEACRILYKNHRIFANTWKKQLKYIKTARYIK